MQKGIFLVNLGTPDSTSVPDVKKYLREFLMDKRVIDIPFWRRWMLINFIIVPFRSPKSAKEYKRLFDENGSPLKYLGFEVRDKLASKLGKAYKVEFGMRYQNPSIAEGLNKLKHCQSVHVIPLFPQYASASTGSVQDKVMEIVKDWQIIPDIKFTSQFFDEYLFIKTIADNARALIKITYDHFIFSYHGIPERQITKGNIDNHCEFDACCDQLNEKNRYCYRAQCFATTRLLLKELNIPEDKHTVTFQSRLGKAPWITPYTDEVLKELPKKGIKKVLVFSPAFIADCLETTIEVGETYQEDFIKAGGEQWDMVPSLNTEDKWVDCLEAIVNH